MKEKGDKNCHPFKKTKNFIVDNKKIIADNKNI